MYKLLIADDEVLERQALRFFVKNSSLDIGDIYECANGASVVQTVLADKPDIIILDIKMPGMSGLEAMEHILSIHMPCKVIFSTAYNYFDYAVKALQMGAMDFMVKPIKKEAFVSVVNKAIDQLDAERQRTTKRTHLDEAVKIMGKKLLGELIQGNIEEESLYLLNILGIENSSHGNTFFIRVKEELDRDKTAHVLDVLKHDLNEAGYKCLLNQCLNSITMLVFAVDDSLLSHLTSILQTITTSVFRDIKMQYFLGIGTEFEEISQIEESYSQARIAAGDISGQYCCKKDGNVQAASNLLKKNGEAVPTEVQNICTYIDKNYAQKITLDSIAEEVGYSKYYISRLFKQYKKVTIVDYLIQVRLKKAKELLQDSRYSVKQISYMIGYADPNYFTWAFKKAEGISPVKYRYSQADEK